MPRCLICELFCKFCFDKNMIKQCFWMIFKNKMEKNTEGIGLKIQSVEKFSELIKCTHTHTHMNRKLHRNQTVQTMRYTLGHFLKSYRILKTRKETSKQMERKDRSFTRNDNYTHNPPLIGSSGSQRLSITNFTARQNITANPEL